MPERILRLNTILFVSPVADKKAFRIVDCRCICNREEIGVYESSCCFSPITLFAAVLAEPARQPRLLPHPDAASGNQRNRDEAGEKGCRRDLSDWAVNESDNRYAQHQVQSTDQRSFMKGAHA
jgi:hypothetical protein